MAFFKDTASLKIGNIFCSQWSRAVSNSFTKENLELLYKSQLSTNSYLLNYLCYHMLSLIHALSLAKLFFFFLTFMPLVFWFLLLNIVLFVSSLQHIFKDVALDVFCRKNLTTPWMLSIWVVIYVERFINVFFIIKDICCPLQKGRR